MILKAISGFVLLLAFDFYVFCAVGDTFQMPLNTSIYYGITIFSMVLIVVSCVAYVAWLFLTKCACCCEFYKPCCGQFNGINISLKSNIPYLFYTLTASYILIVVLIVAAVSLFLAGKLIPSVVILALLNLAAIVHATFRARYDRRELEESDSVQYVPATERSQ